MAALRLALLGVPLMSCVGRPPPVPATVGAAVSGIYRNMFVEAGYAPSAVDAKIAAAFSQLYINGDPSTQRIYFEQPGNATAYVSDMKNNDVRTEGMGYGLMVMLQLGDQPRFDRIWAWVKRFMYHGDWNDPLYGWSAWHCYHNGTVIDEGPAPDGETCEEGFILRGGLRPSSAPPPSPQGLLRRCSSPRAGGATRAAGSTTRPRRTRS